MPKKIIGILLAAGQSTRFGQSKQSFVLPNGYEMALQSALNLQQVVDEVVVVLHPQHTELKTKLQTHGLTCLMLEREKSLMGDSIATAISASMGQDIDGWLIALADMPYIEVTSLKLMATTLALSNTLICAPTYQGQRGHPVGFNAILAESLVQLTGQEGARSILKKHKNKINLVEMTDENVVYDIDYPHQIKQPTS